MNTVKLRSSLVASEEQVRAACQRAIESDPQLRSSLKAAEPGRCLVAVNCGVLSRKERAAPGVGYNQILVAWQLADDRITQLTAAVARAQTTQTKFLTIIPLGPKMIIGVRYLKDFLARLGNELAAIDPNAEVRLS
jgi:hypothetical protein